MPATMITDQPLFNDAEQAVRFGFAICEMGTCPPPAHIKELVRANARRNPRTVGMSQMDWHAEGLLIRKRVHNAPYPLSVYGVGRYSWVDEHRQQAEAILVDHVAAGLSTVRNRQLLTLLVRRYLCQGRADRQRRSEIAVAAGVHHDWCNEVDKRVCAAVDALHHDLFGRLTEQMAGAGLIPAE